MEEASTSDVMYSVRRGPVEGRRGGGGSRGRQKHKPGLASPTLTLRSHFPETWLFSLDTASVSQNRRCNLSLSSPCRM